MKAKLSVALISALVMLLGPNDGWADRVDELINQFLSKSPGWGLAADELRRLGDPRVVKPLIVALKDPDPLVRTYAANILGGIAGAVDTKFLQPAVEPLIATLRDQDPNVRRIAAITLGKIGDKRAIPELERVAKGDENSLVREAAGKARTALAIHVFPAQAQKGQAKEKPFLTALKHNQQGLTYLKSGKVQEAVEALKKAVEIAPGYVEAVNNLGYAYERVGRLDEAIAAYKRAIELDPNRAVAYLNLGAAYAEKRAETPPELKEFQPSFGKIIRSYQKALDLNPNLAEAHVGLGEVYARTGSLSEAIAHYESYLAKWPKGARAEEVKQRTAQLRLFIDGEFDEAVRIFLAEHDPFKKRLPDIERAWEEWFCGKLSLIGRAEGFPVSLIMVTFGPHPYSNDLPEDLRHSDRLQLQNYYLFWRDAGQSLVQKWRSVDREVIVGFWGGDQNVADEGETY